MATGLQFDDIPRVSTIDVESFRRSFQRASRPVVLEGIVDRWPAVGRWTLDYFGQRFGNLDVVALQLKDDHVHVGKKQPGNYRTEKLGEVIDSFKRDAPSRYVSTPLDQLPSDIQQDYQLPAYCADAAWRRPKLWLGPAGTVMPLHFDLSLNLYAMVTGKKRFCLFPPWQSHLLYPCGPFSKAPNFAQVDPEAPDPQRFPRFGRARPVGCVLRGGDLLYIPRGWWHHVRTLDDSIAIGFWYGGYATAALNKASIVYRRLMGQPSGEWG